MASANPFDLLGDDDNDDPSQLIAKQQEKIAAKKTSVPATYPSAKLPTKPLPPAQAVREARSNGRGGQGYVRGGGRGGGGFRQNKDFEKGVANGGLGGYGFASMGGDVDSGNPAEKDRERGNYGRPRQAYRGGGGRRGGYANVGDLKEDSERPPRRVFERHSGTGRGNEFKREGSGKGNWGTHADDVEAQEGVNVEDKIADSEKQLEQVDAPASNTKEGLEIANEQKEAEDKEMTLEEYEKVREEKRKALMAMKAEERKVELDKDLKSMQQLSIKKANDEIFIKLASAKDSKKAKDNADREERSKKCVSINEFLKPAVGEKYYSPGGRGRGGRGRIDRSNGSGPYGVTGGFGGSPAQTNIKIGDHAQFPTLV